MQISLDHWPEGFAGLAFDNMVASSGHTGAGFELRDNVIMNNRGRGMLIKAGNGVVEGNTIIRPTFWPMQVTQPMFLVQTSMTLTGAVLYTREDVFTVTAWQGCRAAAALAWRYQENERSHFPLRHCLTSPHCKVPVQPSRRNFSTWLEAVEADLSDVLRHVPLQVMTEWFCMGDDERHTTMCFAAGHAWLILDGS